MLALAGCLFAVAAQAAPSHIMNKMKAGELVINPGFEWPIQGDDNRTAKVETSISG
jgi:hypothetical protein